VQVALREEPVPELVQARELVHAPVPELVQARELEPVAQLLHPLRSADLEPHS
jgi:hypothetical protein